MPDGQKVCIRTSGTRDLIPDLGKEAQKISKEGDSRQVMPTAPREAGEGFAQNLYLFAAFQYLKLVGQTVSFGVLFERRVAGNEQARLRQLQGQ